MKKDSMSKSLLLAGLLAITACMSSWVSSSSNSSDGILKVNSNCPEYLQGKWKGKYFYSDESSRNISTDFALSIDSIQGNHFSGQVIESRTNWGPADLKEFESSVEGTCSKRSISFIKTYKFPGGHSVDYTGKMQKSQINGNWSIGSDWGGTWDAVKQ